MGRPACGCRRGAMPFVFRTRSHHRGLPAVEQHQRLVSAVRIVAGCAGGARIQVRAAAIRHCGAVRSCQLSPVAVHRRVLGRNCRHLHGLLAGLVQFAPLSGSAQAISHGARRDRVPHVFDERSGACRGAGIVSAGVDRGRTVIGICPRGPELVDRRFGSLGLLFAVLAASRNAMDSAHTRGWICRKRRRTHYQQVG